MNLIVDAQALQSPSSRNRGIGRFARNLIRALVENGRARVITVFNSGLPAPDAGDAALTQDVRWFDPLVSLTPWGQGANERFFGDWLCGLRGDALLIPSLFEGLTVLPRMEPGGPMTVAVIHDLIPLLFHHLYLRDPPDRAFYGERFRQLAHYDVALVYSEATKRDALRFLRWMPDRIATICGAAEPPPKDLPLPAQSAAVLERLGIRRPFLLYVSGYDRRKNTTGAMAAFAKLPPEIRRDHELVIVCALDERQRGLLSRAARRLGVADRVRLTSFVDEAALDVLYRQCRLTVFPSHYEGLGLPLLEAQLRGAPVVASDRSSIPEFAGPGARLANPASPTELAAAITAALAEPYEMRVEERRAFAAGFSWKASASMAIDAIEHALQARAPVTRTRRVAWVSPLPPTPSGIADYSAELLAHMPTSLNVVLVVAPGATVDPSLASRFPVMRPAEVLSEHEISPFDLFVYHIGNSEHHVYMVDLMRQCAGLTVLHDVYVGGLAFRAEEAGSWFGSLAASLDIEREHELAATVRAGTADHQVIAERATLNRPILTHSDAVVVHSASSRARVASASTVPVFCIPMGMPARPARTRDEARDVLGLARDRFIVVTLGEVTPSKRIDRIIDAIAELPERIRAKTTLLVVGDAPEAQAQILAARAAERGLAGQMQLAGRVPLDDLGVFGCAADACVQLRYPVRGETSGALLRALAEGSACMVTRAGSFGELPSEVAVQIEIGEQEVEQLACALIRLHDDAAYADGLRAAARDYVATRHNMGTIVQQYCAAIAAVVAQREARDGDWADAACYALDEARQAGTLDAGVFDRWAEVRANARTGRRG